MSKNEIGGKRLQGVRVPETSGAIETGRDDQATIRTKPRTCYYVVMNQIGLNLLAGFYVPDPSLVILAGRDELFPIGAEVGKSYR